MYDFLHVALVVRFPALGASCIFSRAWIQWHVFPHLALVSCICALGTGYSRGNKCHLMAKSFLREKTEPAIFGIWPVGYSGPRSPRVK